MKRPVRKIQIPVISADYENLWLPVFKKVKMVAWFYWLFKQFLSELDMKLSDTSQMISLCGVKTTRQWKVQSESNSVNNWNYWMAHTDPEKCLCQWFQWVTRTYDWRENNLIFFSTCAVTKMQVKRNPPHPKFFWPVVPLQKCGEPHPNFFDRYKNGGFRFISKKLRKYSPLSPLKTPFTKKEKKVNGVKKVFLGGKMLYVFSDSLCQW